MNGSSCRTSRIPASNAMLGMAILVFAAVLLSSCTNSGSPAVSAPIAAPTFAAQQASPAAPVQITPIDAAHLQNPPVQVTPLLTAVPTPTPTPNPLASIPRSAEQDAARTLLNAQSGVYGFVVMNADGSIISSYNGLTPFITASTYKLVLMADIYRRVELGKLALDDWLYLDPAHFEASGGDMYFGWEQAGGYASVENLLFAVGAWSSNVAAFTLLPYTTPEDLRATAESIGMRHTWLFVDLSDIPYWPPQPHIDSSPEDMAIAVQYVEDSAALGPVNITTPYDMATYQRGLLNDTVISPWVSEQIFNILAQQAIRDRLPVYNWGVLVINKPGNLPDVVNDVGILFLPSGPRAVAMLSEAVPDDLHATHILQLLGLIANGTTDIW